MSSRILRVTPQNAGAKLRIPRRHTPEPVVFALVPAIIVAGIGGSLINPGFLTRVNLIDNILANSAVLGILVIAESVILIGGFFDLSLQSTVGFAPMILATLATPPSAGGLGLPLLIAVLCMVGLVILTGLVNGVMIARMGIPAFIVTLATLVLLQGITIGISGGHTFADLPSAVVFLGKGRVLGIPLQAWVLVLSFVCAGLFMRYIPTGRRIYALGGNLEAARAAGVRVQRLTIGMLVFGSISAMGAGLLLSGRIASVTPTQGNNMIFTVFAAAVIGGISLNGGRGSLSGAFLGVLLLSTIQNILTLSNVPSFWIDAAYGAIILAALVMGWASNRLRAVRSNPRGE